MTNAVITWVETELGILKTDAQAAETSALALAKTFFSDITPVMITAAQNAVLAAITVPGTGAVKAAAAFAAASSELVSQGVPIVENDLKALIQIVYKATPAAVQAAPAAQAVESAAENEVSAVAAKVVAASPASPPSGTAGPAA